MTVVDDIKQKLDIVEVISQSVPLHKAGRNFRALCPFHAEKTPSFYVFPERQTWYCFGACASGGDVFSFLMRKENLEFGEALRLLAQRAGVALAPASPQGKVEEARQERLYQANEAAAQFYQHHLHSPAGAAARRYLEGRGLAPQTSEDFQLGLAPPSGLQTHLLDIGHSREELLAAGLLVAMESGETRDRFPGRLIFPIRNPQGRVAGFGARALDSSLPKYINTPQTEVFDKGGLLYGLDRARASLRRLNQAIIVEGYMDVLLAHQHAFTQVVASMGTSLTERQVALLKRFTRNLVLALDADAAGAAATLRAHEVVSQAGEERTVPVVTPQGLVRYENSLDAELRVLLPPAGQDPDEVIRHSPEAWQRLVKEAQPLVDYILDTMASRHDLVGASGKSAAAQELLPLIGEIKDPVRQAHYLQKLARLLDIAEAALAQGLRRGPQPRARGPYPRGSQAEAMPPLPSLTAGERAEAYCLALLLHYPELRPWAEGLSPDYFQSIQNREVFRAWQQTGLAEALEPALGPHLEALQGWPLPPATPGERERNLRDVIRRLRENSLRRRLQAQEAALRAEAQDSQLAQLQEQGLAASQELQQLDKQRHQIAKLGE